jgi:hypothetical protein
LQVRALYNRDTWNSASPRVHNEALAFVKLCPKRMLPQSTGFPQAQIALVRDLSDGKSWTIQSTRNYTTRAPASLAQHQVAEFIAPPTGRSRQDRISSQVFPARRRIERNPASQSVCLKLLVEAVLRYDQVIGKRDRESKQSEDYLPEKVRGAGHGVKDYTKPLRLAKFVLYTAHPPSRQNSHKTIVPANW